MKLRSGACQASIAAATPYSTLLHPDLRGGWGSNLRFSLYFPRDLELEGAEAGPRGRE